MRPRLFWDGGGGRSAFLTAGVTTKTATAARWPGPRFPRRDFPTAKTLDTRRYDVGGTLPDAGEEQVRDDRARRGGLAASGSPFGDVLERDAHDTAFGEVTARGAAGRQTWVAGAAYERDAFDPRDVPRFGYTFDVPGLFVQDDIDVASWLSLSASARVDFHSEYGTFFSPRLALLFRRDGWTSRLSAAQGFFASTPLTEETEAAGLSRLDVIRPLEAERGRTASLDLTRSTDAGSFTITLFASRVDDPVARRSRRRVCALQPRPGIDQHRGRTAGHVAPRAVRRHLQLHLRPIARGVGGPSSGDAADAAHSAGLVGMWEPEDVGRVGIEVYYTGRQRLEVNPYRRRVAPYVIVGALAERRFGRVRLFPQRREPHRRAPDALGSAGAANAECRRAMDGRWLGAARRTRLQRRGAPGVLRRRGWLPLESSTLLNRRPDQRSRPAPGPPGVSPVRTTASTDRRLPSPRTQNQAHCASPA